MIFVFFAHRSEVTWGRRSCGGGVTLAKVSEICGTAYAFAALMDEGSVVAWGDRLRGGDVPLLRNITKIHSFHSSFGKNVGVFIAESAQHTFRAWGDVPDFHVPLDNVRILQARQGTLRREVAKLGASGNTTTTSTTITTAWASSQSCLFFPNA